MFKWNIADMELLAFAEEQGNNANFRFPCEYTLSQTEKSHFLNEMSNGKFMELVTLCQNFALIKDTLPKGKDGFVKSSSLRVWLQKNDTSELIVRSGYTFGDFEMLGCVYNIYDCPLLNEDCIDLLFHRQLLLCVEKERDYYRDLLQKEVCEKIHKHNTTFGINLVMGFDTTKLLAYNGVNYQVMDIDKLKAMLDKYKRLEEFIAELSAETKGSV